MIKFPTLAVLTNVADETNITDKEKDRQRMLLQALSMAVDKIVDENPNWMFNDHNDRTEFLLWWNDARISYQIKHKSDSLAGRQYSYSNMFKAINDIKDRKIRAFFKKIDFFPSKLML